MDGHVFVSHSSKDNDLVSALSQSLEAYGSSVWTDIRDLAPGDLLSGEIRDAIDDAGSVLAVLSPQAFNSKWMRIEIDCALAIGRRVIPLLIAPMEVGSLGHFFSDDIDAEPVALTFDPEHERLDDLLPRLRVALGELAPDVPEPVAQPAPAPLAELIVRLDDPEIDEAGGERRAQATATLRYVPPLGAVERAVESKRFRLRAPIGPIEAGELAWYLERFAVWPSAIYKDRAEAVETQLAEWGRALFDVLDVEAGHQVWQAFRAAPENVERVISIRVDPDPPDGDPPDGDTPAADDAPEGEAKEANPVQEAATLLLGLPWELLRDDHAFVAAGKRGVRVRRRLPNREAIAPLVTATPVRVLVVSPRPEDERASYIDHRVSARPLVDAFAALGGRVELEILGTPTLAGLSEALATAEHPYHVVHFDGHGIYSPKLGLGALCFEDPADADKLERRRSDLVTADKLAEVMHEYRVPLVFLEACQSARADEDPSASVAGRLLRGGVASVLAMSHSVLVATAERFVEVFYARLSAGATVGAAMLAAQRRLRDDPSRGRSFFGDLKLADWFVPVLYQEEVDPQLVRELPGRRAREDIALLGRKAVEGLPASPEHGFVGRSRELLKVERLLVRERFAVLVGEGGEGKTALAVELARWLVESRRFAAAAFVSVEDGRVRDARAVLSVLARQLVPGFAETDFERGWRLVERRLRDRPTLLVFDNMESVLPPAELGVFEPEILEGILGLALRCTEVGATRVVFTSRSELPAPVAENVVRIGRLEPGESVAIVAQVLGISGEVPAADGGGAGQEDIDLLVETAQHHARSLVLLAQEVKRSGVRRTTEGLRELMVTMAERYPDDRERSLFASVELSLRRLPEEMRQKLRRIGVFQGGGHGFVIAQVLGLDYKNDEEVALGDQLIAVGLAERMAYQHLRLHPALPPMMLREMSEAEREEARGVWVAAMTQLVDFLLQQRSKDAQLAAGLTLLELPNLLAALDALWRSERKGGAEADRVVDVATSLEGLLQHLGRPKALARVVAAREEASRRLGEWSHARFEAESAAIDRLLDAGRVAEAVKKAEELLRRARAADTSEGAEPYAGAAYDLAVACIRLGRALKKGGGAAAALEPLGEARQRFAALAEAGSADAERMAAVSLTDIGDCLTALGRLDEAADAYEATIELAEARDDRRDVAAGKFQLGTVRMLQRRYGDALEAQSEARQIFEQLGEPGAVATAWHQIGMVHQQAGQLDAAEHASQQALAVWVQRNDRPREAATLTELGNLYSRMGRLEDSVRFYRDAVTIAVELGDLKSEGLRRNNLADKLIKLRRHDEARQEILRAIECDKPFGHAAQPWKTFDILHDLERAVGDASAAAEARQRTVEAFLAYRRDGGENLTGSTTAKLCLAVRQAIAGGEVDAVASQLAQLAGRPDLPDYLRRVIPALQAILSGSRDPELASDPELDYDDAAELRLLLESLA